MTKHSKPSSIPDVFIIESLHLEDEPKLREGHRIKDMLTLSGKSCKYYYLRTEQELREILPLFQKSRYRYLHLSCHGCKDGLSTTWDFYSIPKLGEILGPYLDNRRVFLSACGAANMSLARELMDSTRCRSLMGAYARVWLNDTPLFWATFYHLLLKDDRKTMSHKRVLKHGKAVARMFRMRMALFSKKKGEIVREVLFDPDMP